MSKSVKQQYLLLAYVLALVSDSSCFTDLTREPKSHGTHVVTACVRLVQESGIFHINSRLLRNIALVETQDGNNAFTYSDDAQGGGIWGVHKEVFEETKTDSLLSDSVRDYFKIDWNEIEWEDLNTPLYSAIAAGIHIHHSNQTNATTENSDIPVEQQINLWKSLTRNKRIQEDFAVAVMNVNNDNALFPNVEEIVLEMEAREQQLMDTKQYELSTEVSMELEIEFTVTPGGSARLYASNVIATSSAVYFGSTDGGRLFLNSSNMFHYGVDNKLFISVEGSTGSLFNILVKQSVSSEKGATFVSESSEFIIGMFSNHPDVGSLPIKLLLTTLETAPVQVIIENITNQILTVNVTSTPTEVLLPDQYVVSNVNETMKGLRLTTVGDKRIGVSVGSSYVYSTDSYHALPVIEYVGLEEYTYYGITPDANVTGLKSRLLLVGNYDYTSVTITVNQESTMINNVTLTPNQPHVIEINRLETVLIESEMSLTGSQVVTNKPISFFSGHQCAVVPESGSSCDFAIEQFPPSVTYGKQFMVQMLSSRSGGSHFTLLTSRQNTNVSLWCGLSSTNQTLNHSFVLDSPGSYKTLEIAPDDVICSIITSEPCVLAVFGTSENSDENDGDPLLIMIPPVEQFSTSALYKKNENLTSTYVNVVVMGDYSNLLLDGSPLTSFQWNTIQAPSLGMEEFGFATQFQINDSMLHNLTSENTMFSALLYGFDFSVGYGQRVGMMLKPIANEFESSQPQVVESIKGRELTCSTGGLPAYAFTWEKDGSIITSSTSKFSITSNNHTDSILTINDPSPPADNGLYTCKIYSYYTNNGDMSKSLTIDIPELPAQNEPTLAFVHQQYGNTENESVTITIVLSNNDPTDQVISWKFEDSSGTVTYITNSTDQNKYILSENGVSLNVLHLQLGEHGTISVAVRSGGFTVTQTVPLTVYVPVAVNSSQIKTIEENIGKNLALYCYADGIDAPVFIWRKEKTLLLSSSKFVISEKPDNSGFRDIDGIKGLRSTLTITSLTTSDNGTYYCVVNNAAGISVSNTFNVQVISPNHCESNSCNGNGECISLDSSYVCRCYQGYEGTNCDTKIQVTVFINPSITTPPSDLRVELYDTGRLHCTAEGIPHPIITWYKNGKNLTNTNADSSQLVFQSIKLSDRGVYHCEASNIDATGTKHKDTSESVILNINNVVQYEGNVNISNANQARIDSLLSQVNERLSGMVVDGSTYFLLEKDTSNHIASRSQQHTLIPILLTVLVNVSTQWNTSSLVSAVLSEFPVIAQSLQIEAILLTDNDKRFDGCRPSSTIIPSQLGNKNLNIELQWPETNIGVTAYQECPCGDISSDNSLVASRYCGGDFSSGGQWKDAESSDCNFSDLARTLCNLTQLDVPERIQRLDELTSTTEKINETELTISVSILVQTTEQVSGNRTLSEGFFSVTSNLLVLNETIVQNTVAASNSSARLRESFFMVADDLPLSGNDSQTIILRPAFAVSVKQYDVMDFKGLNYSVSADFTQNSTEYDVQFVSNDNSTASISLPSTLFDGKTVPNNSRSVISNSVFINNNAFLVRNPGSFVVGSVILSARVVGFPKNSFNDLDPPVELSFQQSSQHMTSKSPVCVFFDTAADDGFGSWSSDGCYLNVSIQANFSVCTCDHLTSFSILLDVSPVDDNGSDHSGVALTAISYIGLCTSIICLAITILSHLSSKKLRKLETGQILVNLCVALMGLYITFIIAIYAKENTFVCSVISALLQYFFLVTFMSMAIEAVSLYVKLILIFKNIEGFVIKSIIISWVIPIFIVVFCFAPNYENYVSEFFCRPSDVPYYVGMIVPFIVIYVFNWIIFVLTFASLAKRSIEKMKSEETKDQSVHYFVRQQLVTAILLSTLLGVGWGIGLFVTSDLHTSSVSRDIVSAIFVLLTAFHGFFIFIMHCLRSEDVRTQWKKWFFTITRQRYTESKANDSTMKKQQGKKRYKQSTKKLIQLTENSSYGYSSSLESNNHTYDTPLDGDHDSTLKFNIAMYEKNEKSLDNDGLCMSNVYDEPSNFNEKKGGNAI